MNNITNVVLDRDKRIVTFDTGCESLQKAVYYSGDLGSWRCGLSGQYYEAINEALVIEPRYAQWDGDLAESKPDQDITPDYYNKTYKGVKLDPYRVCKIYDVNGGPREHIVKKLLRGINKDDGINTELDLINVVEGQLRRWKEMIQEDEE